VSRLDHPGVRRVQAALAEKGSRAAVIDLEVTARSAQDAADALGVELGAIVKSLLFTIDGAPVMALVAGDRRCDIRALPSAFGRSGLVLRADAERVRAVTGYVIGGVPPLGHPRPLPTAIDDSLAASRRSMPPPATRTASSRPPCSSSRCSPAAR
jgi:prolyl-tRNA editing enzyme YbaK/EbsC (Cys-tRNA(Pro) deacylase)